MATVLKQPITFASGNLVFGAGPRDAWGLYRLRARSYTGLSAAARQDLVAGVTALAHAAGSDFSLLRVARPWSVQRYAMGVQAAMDICHGARDALGAYLRRQEETLRRREAHTPEIYLAVSLPSGPRRLLALADRGTISTRRLHALALEEAELFARLRSCLDCRRVAPEDLQWLIRRSFCRSLGDPVVDEQFRPQALVGDAHFEPLGADVLRLFDSPINVEPRSLPDRIRARREPSDVPLRRTGAGAARAAVRAARGGRVRDRRGAQRPRGVGFGAACRHLAVRERTHP